MEFLGNKRNVHFPVERKKHLFMCVKKLHDLFPYIFVFWIKNTRWREIFIHFPIFFWCHCFFSIFFIRRRQQKNVEHKIKQEMRLSGEFMSFYAVIRVFFFWYINPTSTSLACEMCSRDQKRKKRSLENIFTAELRRLSQLWSLWKKRSWSTNPQQHES